MNFVLNLVTFILASALAAVCLFAIPGPPREEEAGAAHGHGHGHDHGHGGH